MQPWNSKISAFEMYATSHVLPLDTRLSAKVPDTQWVRAAHVFMDLKVRHDIVDLYFSDFIGGVAGHWVPGEPNCPGHYACTPLAAERVNILTGPYAEVMVKAWLLTMGPDGMPREDRRHPSVEVSR